jgi:multidrug efflux system membrane fusion protein
MRAVFSVPCFPPSKALLVAGLAVSVLVAGCKPAAPKSAVDHGTPVSAVKAKKGSIDIYLDAIGTVTPVYTATITSRVAGQITEIHYTEGQMVKKGDLLAVVDPRPYEAALQQAQGQLAKDQALLKNAQIDLTRYQNAYQEHAIPQQQLATAQAAVEGDQGTVEVDQGAVQVAQVNVDYAHIVSPIDGRVGLRLVDLGNNVAANGTTPLVTVTQLQPITVIFNLAEDHISDVVQQTQKGKKLKVIALDRSQTTHLADGTLLTLDNSVDVTTGTVKARATFANDKFELFPYQFVNARLLIKTLKDVIVVPTAAVQLTDAKSYAYVVKEDGTVEVRDIKVLAAEGESSAVSGVNVDEQLVTDGFDRLQKGTKVTIKESAGKGATHKAPVTPAPESAEAPKPTGDK